jgi:hypothetical protein
VPGRCGSISGADNVFYLPYETFWEDAMAHRSVRNWLAFMVLISLAMTLHDPLLASQIEINGDKISIEANQTPIRELLTQLSANYGITVRIDPDITPLVTVSFKNRDLEDGLKAILKPHNLIFVWKASSPATGGSTSPTYKLDEIHIFKPGQKDRMVNIQEPDQSAPSEDQPQPEAEPEAETEPLPETRVIIKNNKVYVPVTLGYENNEIETTLIFDTGAGSIILHANVAQQLGIEQGQASQGEGVGGIKIATRTTRLSFVQVGPFKKDNLRADIIAYEGAGDADYNGLLGMNFIRGLKYTIDFNEQVIRWQR